MKPDGSHSDANPFIDAASLSFDGLIELYEETRVVDDEQFQNALAYLARRFPPARFPHLFEPGIGTGRIALPLADYGYRVTGADLSGEMLSVFDRRRNQRSRTLPISLLRADVTDLPFRDASFDLAVVVHLFYFVRQWRAAADEIMRVVRPGGPVALMHTGMGMEIPLLNERYKELCAQQGCPISSVGVTSTREVVTYYQATGRRVEVVEELWGWTTRIALQQALGYLRGRAYSFTTLASEEIHRAAMIQLTEEARQHYGDLTTVVQVPNQIRLIL